MYIFKTPHLKCLKCRIYKILYFQGCRLWRSQICGRLYVQRRDQCNSKPIDVHFTYGWNAESSRIRRNGQNQGPFGAWIRDWTVRQDLVFTQITYQFCSIFRYLSAFKKVWIKHICWRHKTGDIALMQVWRNYIHVRHYLRP